MTAEVQRKSAPTFTCFFKSCGRLKALPQNSHLCGLSGTCTRMWEVIWSRFTVVVRQVPHAQVKHRLLVDLRPTWISHKWFFDELVVTSAKAPQHEKCPASINSQDKNTTTRLPLSNRHSTTSLLLISKQHCGVNIHIAPLANRTFPGTRSIGSRGLSPPLPE